MIAHRIVLAGVDCAVVEWNPSAKGIPLMALHGWLDNLATFEPLLPALSKRRILAIDFPGHGHSAHLPPGMEYHFVDGVLLIEDLANHFQLERFNLLGHSMGGSVATLYAAARTEKVAKLTLIEALGPLSESAEASAQRLGDSLTKRSQLTGKQKPRYSDFAQALAARAVASKIAPQFIQPVVERGLIGDENGYTWRSDPRLRTGSMMRYSESQVRALLAQIHVPALLIEGMQGYFVDNELAKQRKACFPQLEIVKRAGGHHLHLENPREIGEIIDKFVADS